MQEIPYICSRLELKRERLFPLFSLGRLMSAMSITEEIQRIAEERFQEDDLKDCFILDIEVAGKKISVFIDTDQGVKFSQCQKLSRAIEAVLDESQKMGEDYQLEVSSPGIDKSLKLYRQYPRNIGRKVALTFHEGEPREGKLLEVSQEEIKLRIAGAKKGMFKEITLPFENIATCHVQVSFKK